MKKTSKIVALKKNAQAICDSFPMKQHELYLQKRKFNKQILGEMEIIVDGSKLKKRNFKLQEFFISDTANKHGIDNTKISYRSLLNLDYFAMTLAQNIRDILQKPVKIKSGYRCLELNRKLGSADSSKHLKGQAIDFECLDFGTPEEIVRFLKEKDLNCDVCLIENGWVHISSVDWIDNRKVFGFWDEKNKKFTSI